MTRATRPCHALPRAALRRIVERATVSGSMIRLAVPERARERTAAPCRERIHFERPSGSIHALSQRAAAAEIHVEAIRLALRDSDRRGAAGVPEAVEVTAS